MKSGRLVPMTDLGNTKTSVVSKPVSVIPNVKNLMGNDYAKNTLMILRDALADYRISNKNLAKLYAEKYLRTHVRDARLVSFMLKAMQHENVNMGVDDCDFVSGYHEDSDMGESVDNRLKNIRENHRWFFDLMLYLNGTYTDRQLLNSEFVKIIKKRDVLQKFDKNATVIDCLAQHINNEYTNYKHKLTEMATGNTQQKIK